MKTRIIIDSTVDLEPEMKSRFTIVPLTVHFGDAEYTDGVTISHQQFYEMLETAAELPTTSQATPEAFDRVLRTLEKDEGAVILTLASGLSGTYQSATIAAEEYENVYVVDTCSATIGAGILAQLALELAEVGKTAAEIFAQLEQVKHRIRVVAVMDTLEYLQKGGRISKAAAVAGGLLHIKPLILVENGQVRMLAKARGSKMVNSTLGLEIQKVGGIDLTMPCILGYTGVSDGQLQNYIAENADLWQDGARIAPIGSVIGTHAGPNAFAVAFYTK